MRCKDIFVFIFVIFLLGLASAYPIFSENGSFITTQYETNHSVKANLNISFFNDLVSSNFSDSLGNSISLANLLALNPDYFIIYTDLTNTTISSASQNLKLDGANFRVPSATGNLTYTLSFNGNVLFTRTFEILSSKSLIQTVLDDKYSQLNASKVQIAKYSPAIQNVLNEFLNISSIENSLNEIKAESTGDITSEQYNQLLNNLSAIKLPSSISQLVTTNPISFYPSREGINLDILAIIAGGSYGSNKEGYVDAVYAWNNKNLKTDLSFSEIYINYLSGEQTTLRIFQFALDKGEGGISNTAYFIVQDLEGLKFEGIPVSQIGSSSGYFYLNINSVSDNIVFSTTQDVDFINVPVFISPSLNDLTPVKVEPYTRWIDNKNSKWILFAIIVFIVLLIGVITYVLLQRWYRRKYEVHLFKNRSNLFNIMTYIQNSKKKNMPREEIMKNLKKAGWSGEQINYAMRKYEGKKIIGLIKMPLNITPETEKKVEKNPQRLSSLNNKPVYKRINMAPGTTNPPTTAAGKPPEKTSPQNNPNKNTKV
jgi:hypothetical protein